MSGVSKIVLEDGRELVLEHLMGSCGDSALDVSSVHKNLGVFLYDPGFLSTAPCQSKITFVDGDNGLLLYRGHLVGDLINEGVDFLSVAYLLIYGSLPNKTEYESFTSDMKDFPFEGVAGIISSFPIESHPMAILGACLAYFASFHGKTFSHDVEESLHLGRQAIGRIPCIVAMIHRHISELPFIPPKEGLDYIQNFLYMLFGEEESSSFVKKAIETFFILHADHEQNASTLALRTACSTDANILACTTSAAMTLWGAAHGGANEAVIRMLEQIQGIDNVDDFVLKVKSGGTESRLMGFGHRVYKNYDPRAKVMKVVCRDVIFNASADDSLLKIAMKLEEVALTDEYFIKRKLYPNVDFYSGLLLQAIGISSRMFTLFFALARTSGWVAQWYEMVNDPSVKKIWRPRQIYIGNVKSAK